MPTGRNLFTGRTITGNAAAPSAVLPVNKVDFISVGVQVTQVAGPGATATFGVQWSFDGDNWTNPADDPDGDVIGVVTAQAYLIKRMQVKAPYWRLVAFAVTGTFVVTGNALVWND
jgi:hypothetical protein